MLNQTFELQDLGVIGFLVVLEGVLSIDNALVLGLLARRVPKHLQSRALTYGLIGAVVFRFAAIGFAQLLLKWHIAKLIGGLYLIYISAKYFISELSDKTDEKIVLGPDQEPQLIDDATGKPLNAEQADEELEARIPIPIPTRDDEAAEPVSPSNPYEAPKSLGVMASPAPSPPSDTQVGMAGFWSTVLVIELTDIAFAIDSILAAIALVGSAPPDSVGLHPKFWVILSGGLIGVALMRVAAVMFIRLLEKFPRLEVSAYLLVIVIGLKLCLDWGFNAPGEPSVLDFHSPKSLAFIVFWATMVVCFLIGFIPKEGHARPAPNQ